MSRPFASVARPAVHGLLVDGQTRCEHWHGPLDVIAIRMYCCGEYFACRDCHAALADHSLQPWPLAMFHQPAVLCGVCAQELSVAQYLACNAQCPHCGAAFNPRCALHYPDYFETA